VDWLRNHGLFGAWAVLVEGEGVSDYEKLDHELREFGRLFMKEAVEPWAVPVLKWIQRVISKEAE
jgi:hypothetical protein